MTTFAEQFPSLEKSRVCTEECFRTDCKEDRTHAIHCDDVMKCCLDKQKVREAIKHAETEWCKSKDWDGWRDLEKGLGLND